jgi:long-chain acyl-CoA synthetase
MGQKIKYTIPEMLRHSFREYGNRTSLVFAGEEDRNYAGLEEEVAFLCRLLNSWGIRKGDKVVILSTNMPNWGVAFFAISTLGAVVVPILPDFSISEINNIVRHSEPKVLFVSESLLPKIDSFRGDPSKVIVQIESFANISSLKNSQETVLEPVDFEMVEEDDLLSIIYTSGTTGKSKGVMLSHKNVVWDAEHGGLIHRINCQDRFLSLLPLSHTYENTIGLIFPVMYGASVHYLRKLPTPAVLIPALQMVKPTVMLTVPLIIEKIYKKQIEPKFNQSWVIRLLYSIYPIRLLLNRMAGRKLKSTFGGKLIFFGIGGAKLDNVVEKFLHEAKFPYSIGFGLTETSPLIAGAGPKATRLNTIGPAMPGNEVIINQPDPKTGQGEIWIKGPNVMKGYYKEPALTKEVLTDDGWFKTGDLGLFDKKGYLAFKGRLKNMIVSASGENIYPEEIESVINNFNNVVESLVIQRKGKLVALVRINMEELETQFQSFRDQADVCNERLNELLQELQLYVNSHVSKFSQVQVVLIQQEPFERTPTLKIKRFLYTQE